MIRYRYWGGEGWVITADRAAAIQAVSDQVRTAVDWQTAVITNADDTKVVLIIVTSSSKSDRFLRERIANAEVIRVTKE